ncbi:MAG: hypothetical protein K2M30_05230 [Desulfovibrionaceae bacterium]|nr:hypothetical protein [Desulfovibrionaceae bacterium]
MNKWPVTIAIPTAIAVCVALLSVFIIGGSKDTIAVLDYKKIISESTAVKKAGDYFSELQESYKTEIDGIKDPKEQVAVLEQKQADFAKKIEALDEYLNTTLEEIISKYRASNSISIIFPKDAAISLDGTLDITNAIIQEFNKVSLENKEIEQIISKSVQEEAPVQNETSQQPEQSAE